MESVSLAVHKNDVFVITTTSLIIKSTGLDHEIKHEGLRHIGYNIFVDSQKNLYRLVSGTLESLTKLTKNPIMAYVSDKIYTADGFGDIYKIEGGEARYFTGVMCKPVALVANNDYVCVGDEYGRVRVCSSKGEIIDILFYSEKIIGIFFYKQQFIVATSSFLKIYNEKFKEVEIIHSKYKLSAFYEDGFYFYGENKIFKFDGACLIQVMETTEEIFGLINGEIVYKKDENVFIGKNRIL